MAQTKVSDLAALTTTDGAEELLINDGGTSKKVTIANLLHDESIDSDHYVDGSIDAVHLSANSVDSDAYVDGSIDEVHIADDAVTADKLANSINSAISANTAKVTNATHTGDVTGATALTIAVDAVDIAMLSATGTASSSTFLRGDNSWVTPTDTNTTYSVTDGELSEINFTSADHTKLNAIEASADVTDATNVTAAGALMDSEVTNLAEVKAFADSDYATAAQGTLATNALPKAGGTMTGDILFADGEGISLGAGTDLTLLSDGSTVMCKGDDIRFQSADGTETYFDLAKDGGINLRYNNLTRIQSTSAGATVTGTLTATLADNSIGLAQMAGGTDGNIISYDASGDPVAIATGNDGQVLTSTGAGSPPAFEDAAGGGATHTSNASAPGSPSIGDFWHDTGNEKLYIRTNDGTSDVWMQI